jgi:hypothetical protein
MKMDRLYQAPHKSTILGIIFTIALILGYATPAKADITSTIAPTDGTGSFGPFPSSLIDVGTFSFTIPSGESIVGATISGTFGNMDVPGLTDVTAPSDYSVDGGAIEVASCDDSLSYDQPCDAGSSPTAWSYTFTSADLATLAPALASGSLDFDVVQNGVGAVNTGTTTLTLTPTPEPETVSLFSLGIMCFGFLRRFRKA